ncbi:hypothetical protein HY375_03350 [Candidatus Berkelbacteria bacterium]|nr:hypothetical protein [Candidatus Berkelbacteria bacterium]
MPRRRRVPLAVPVSQTSPEKHGSTQRGLRVLGVDQDLRAVLLTSLITVVVLGLVTWGAKLTTLDETFGQALYDFLGF